MRRKKMLDAMGLLDEKYVAEAEIKKKSPHRRAWITIAAAAACFGIVLGSFGIYRLVNRDTSNIEQYRDSEYYPLMQKLAAFEEDNWNVDYLNAGFAGGSPEQSFGGAFFDGDAGETVGASQSYEEATDNQVEGVIEGDLIKRSDRYIYYLNSIGRRIHVYSIEKEDSKEVGCYAMGRDSNIYVREMYLSSDCQTLTLLATSSVAGEGFTRYQTVLIALDVSNPASITEKQRVTVDGSYLSSRVVDGKLLLLNSFSVREGWQAEKEESFVPQIDKGNGFESIPMSKIVMPDTMTSVQYTVVCRFDEAGLTLEDSVACLSYSGTTVYVSHGSLYLSRSRTEIQRDEAVTRTDILRIAYAQEQMEAKGTAVINGTLKDSYSMDEYNGILRTVTATERRVPSNRNSYELTQTVRNASLYAIDVTTMEIVSAVENFAPEGESVYSVRFDGDVGYVCTALRVFNYFADPVFFFDLSDVHNITYKDTGTIPGVSTSLIQYGDGLLLGIGTEEDQLKVETYMENGSDVVSVSKYFVSFDADDFGTYSTEYKSYLVDREHMLFGFGVHHQEALEYKLLKLENGELVLWHQIDFKGKSVFPSNVRAAHIDGYLYVFINGQFAVRSLAEPQA